MYHRDSGNKGHVYVGVTKVEAVLGRSCHGKSYGDPSVVCKNFSPARWEILHPAPPNLLWGRELCTWWRTEGGGRREGEEEGVEGRWQGKKGK